MTRPVAIVTGAANNIGLACARRFAQTHTIVMADIQDTGALAKELPGAVPAQGDISRWDDCRSIVETALAEGPLDALVHSAGITKPPCSILEMPPVEWELVVRVNLTGAFLMAKACIEPMIRQKSGSMVLFTSRAAKTGFAALGANGDKSKAHYCASKAGVISLTKSLALELGQHNVRVNAVAPGPVQGTMIPQSQWASICEKVPLRRMGTPEDMAEAAYFLASPAANFITGHILDVNGGTLMD